MENRTLRMPFRKLLAVFGIGLLNVITAQAAPVIRVTSTGAIFTRVDRPGFGESWQDPSGQVWGDEVKDSNAVPLNLIWQKAIKYCSDIGGTFPSKVDYTRLREYMGAFPETNNGFSPQILPNLDNQNYWSQSYSSELAFSFNGHSGSIVDYDITYNYSMNFRCVTR